MKNNPLLQLEKSGQSIWLDYIRRDLMTYGELNRLIEEVGLKGITSNPLILEKAIAETHVYDLEIRGMAKKSIDYKTIYENIRQKDIQIAADEFRHTFDKTNKREGYVSVDINPHIAYDTQATIEEARKIWSAINRPNILIKIPATNEGLPAIQQLISEGININATLIFSLPRYRQVAKVFITGLEIRAADGKPLNNIASVAGFSINRIDSMLDPIVDDYAALGGEQKHFATEVRGQIAISFAKEAYRIYKELFVHDRFKELADLGASSQRLLWVNTKTKNPDYSDIKYIEELIGKDSINTLTFDLIDAYQEYGEPKENTIEQNLEKASWVLRELPEIGIDISSITQQLEKEGLEKLIKPYDKLMETLKIKSRRYICKSDDPKYFEKKPVEH